MTGEAASDTLLVCDPHCGGRIARLRVEGRDLLHPPSPGGDPLVGGSFPMVPFAGRIRHGRFRFAGTTYELPGNLGGHAIHGYGYQNPWKEMGDGELALAFGSPWPFGGEARQRIVLGDGELMMTLAVTAGERPMPAQLGWHPWFIRPDELDFRAAAMYRRDEEGIALDELVPVPPGPWDDAFSGVTQPVVLRWGELRVELTSSCPVWVVYDEQPDTTCVEPSSGPPDGFTIAPHVLAPGETLEHWFRWCWRR